MDNIRKVKLVREDKPNCLSLRSLEDNHWIVWTQWGREEGLAHKTEEETIAYLYQKAQEEGLEIIG